MDLFALDYNAVDHVCRVSWLGVLVHGWLWLVAIAIAIAALIFDCQLSIVLLL